MKLAIVHDYLVQYGGAERVVETLHEVFPAAPVYTSICDFNSMPRCFRTFDVRTSFLQYAPWEPRRSQRWFLMFYPLAFRQFNLDSFDIILSSSSSFAKGVRTGWNVCHICYCYTPTRFVWQLDGYIERENFNGTMKKTLPAFMRVLRHWDVRAARGVGYYIAISRTVAERIKKCYDVEAEIIYPPVRVSQFELAEKGGDYFLVVSRLVPYKRVDIAVEAFSQLGIPLVVVGEGRDRRRLEQLAKPNVCFTGKVSDEQLKEYYRKCIALIFPGEEDFGIVPIEAHASGKPVIAYAAGGVLETVVDGLTGSFFCEQTPEALVEAIRNFDFRRFDHERIREHAMRFDAGVFERKIRKFVEEKWEEHRRGKWRR